jgi:hypothetical protein
MVGSDPTLVAIVVPIVALVSLAFWLGLCFYAGSHPFWRHHQQEISQRQLASSGQSGSLPPPASQGLPRAPSPAAAATGAERVADR